MRFPFKAGRLCMGWPFRTLLFPRQPMDCDGRSLPPQRAGPRESCAPKLGCDQRLVIQNHPGYGRDGLGLVFTSRVSDGQRHHSWLLAHFHKSWKALLDLAGQPPSVWHSNQNVEEHSRDVQQIGVVSTAVGEGVGTEWG